ncbi:MAG: hypothetical protein ABTB30_08635, partial [Clostridia bacterium]
ERSLVNLFIEFLHLYAFISVPPISVNTIVLSLATVTYSTRLPQSVSSKSETASGSFSSSTMNRSNSRLRMPPCQHSAALQLYWAYGYLQGCHWHV